MDNIPVKPAKVRRVNLALDFDLWARATALKIDIHEFFRRKLQEAVETLEEEPPPYREIPAKLREAIERAQGPFPTGHRQK